MAEANYCHSNVYTFNRDAVQAVVSKLQEVVNSPAVKCWYDKELEGFELVCPQPVGPEADGALHEAITTYVENELEAAEREEREPNIHRFPESLLDDFDTGEEEEDYEATETANGLRVLPQQPTPKHGDNVLHCVAENDGEPNIKLFNLRDTGEGMLERTLVHPGEQAKITVYRAFACRAAKWNYRQDCFVFNGRAGNPVPADDSNTGAFLRAAPAFQTLVSQMPQAASGSSTAIDDNAQPIQANSWFIKGEPSVAQFLDGVGKLELLDPETAKDVSEVPSDALRYNAAPEHEVRTHGRMRVPAPQPSEPDEDDSDEALEPGQPAGKNALLRLTHSVAKRSQGTSSRSDNATSEDDDEDDEDDTDSNPILSKLKNSAKQASHIADDQLPVAPATEPVPAPASATPNADGTMSHSFTVGSHLHSSTNGTVAPTVAMQEYNQRYARVDRAGLTGHATSQAQWEHDNPSPPAQRLNKYGIARRAPAQRENLSPQPTSGSSAAMSLSTGPDAMQRQRTPTPVSSFSRNPRSLPPLTMLENPEDVEPENQPWLNQTQSSAIMTDSLVDLHDPPMRSRAPTGRVRPPPGLEYGPERSDSMTTSGGGSDTAIRQSRFSSSESKAPAPNQLINISPEEAPRANPSISTPWSITPLAPTVRLPRGRAANLVQDNDSDAIIERLQDTTNNSQPLRNTMRQKASKKKKSKPTSAGAASRVDLPKPDPLPPPKRRTAEASQGRIGPHEDVREGSQVVSGEMQNDPVEHSATPTQQPRLKPLHIETLLSQVEQHYGHDNVELAVSFGILVVRPLKDPSFCNGNFKPATLQKKLQAQESAGTLRTDFFERLTTSPSDAAYLFDLLPGQDRQPIVEYDITIKLLQGETRTVRFEQGDRGSFSIHCPEQHVVTLFMHYPVRVHDARSTIIEHRLAEDVDTEAVESLVKSIHTLDDCVEPSFQAKVPQASFHVDTVHVKRVFAKDVVEGVRLTLTEVQELKVDTITGNPNANLTAIGTGRADMVERQMLWYECSLHLTPIDNVQGGTLQDLVDTFVAEIDGVGHSNVGPYMRTEIEEEMPEVPKFW